MSNQCSNDFSRFLAGQDECSNDFSRFLRQARTTEVVTTRDEKG